MSNSAGGVGESATNRDTQPPRGRRARWVVLAGGVALAVALAGVLAATNAASSSPDAQEQQADDPETVLVTAGDMVERTDVPGVLRYDDMQPVISGSPGVLTELLAPGTVINRGDALYRVDTVPVLLLHGSVPAWRDLTRGIDDGADVRQLEENLSALGFFPGAPDDSFDGWTESAVERWQDSLGLAVTGVVERTSILFAPDALRVDAWESRVGAEVGPGVTIYQASSPRMIVDVELRSADRTLAVVGASEKVSLPDGEEIDGVVESVGAPMNRQGDDGRDTVVIPLRLRLDDQAAVAELALASVNVSFASALREDVLTVPVDALVPIDESRFAVELPQRGADGKRSIVPVTVGAFASGSVEISGAGIREGLEVVVPG